MNDSKKNDEKKKISFKWDGKEYNDIEAKEGKQKITSTDGTSLEGENLTSTAWKTSAVINGKEETLKRGWGFHCAYAIPLLLLALGGLWFFISRRKNKDQTQEEDAL